MYQINLHGEYINNREWTEIVFKDSYARYQDLASWGVEFLKDEAGELRKVRYAELRPYARPSFTEGLAIMYFPGPGSKLEDEIKSLNWALVLRKQAVNSGVTIMDRVMVTDLLKQDGKIGGAIGIPMESDDLYIFKAKATVISAGSGGFKPWGGRSVCYLTTDGHAMAYRAGAQVTGKEFVGYTGRSAEISLKTQPRERLRGGRLTNAEGDEVKGGAGSPLNVDFEAHAGRAPLFRGKIRTTGSLRELYLHVTPGIWPINTKCATSVPGLYAAGDSLGTMVAGATYSSGGLGTSNAAVTGARAGLSAAEYALQAEKPTVDEEGLVRVKKITHAPLERKGGFSPRWVTQILQNLIYPYYIMRIKHGNRMKAALTLVEFLRDHLVPKLTAKDPHELRLAHETKNMVLNAEMKLRASLFRTESRGCHYREDYPRRVDPDWLAWVLLKEENGQMTVAKKPIPKAWWPDLSRPYKERYPYRFPQNN
jgi:succinate dehydrogenase/fumarate reductase flavoprotein subunit